MSSRPSSVRAPSFSFPIFLCHTDNSHKLATGQQHTHRNSLEKESACFRQHVSCFCIIEVKIFDRNNLKQEVFLLVHSSKRVWSVWSSVLEQTVIAVGTHGRGEPLTSYSSPERRGPGKGQRFPKASRDTPQ